MKKELEKEVNALLRVYRNEGFKMAELGVIYKAGYGQTGYTVNFLCPNDREFTFVTLLETFYEYGYHVMDLKIKGNSIQFIIRP